MRGKKLQNPLGEDLQVFDRTFRVREGLESVHLFAPTKEDAEDAKQSQIEGFRPSRSYREKLNMFKKEKRNPHSTFLVLQKFPNMGRLVQFSRSEEVKYAKKHKFGGASKTLARAAF